MPDFDSMSVDEIVAYYVDLGWGPGGKHRGYNSGGSGVRERRRPKPTSPQTGAEMVEEVEEMVEVPV